MFKKFLPLLLLMAVLFLPGIAAADTLKPVNGDTWTLYVFGNGAVVFNILESIKLLINPDSGSSGFNTLLMFLATVGFLVLAVQAGFDPAKNLMKMFSYILVVSAVHIMTMTITANILVKDPVTNYENVVPDVPALVGVPAAIVSEVGHWFTKTIESYFTIPSDLTVTGGSFNLFGRLMQESNEFVISNPDLKKSLSAYTSDCVVPAMAQGKLTASELMTSPKMTDTLGKASHKAILTKYWPQGTPQVGGGMKFVDKITHDGVDYTVQGGLGAVLPCEGAWAELSKAMEAHANELTAATAQQWSKTGVLVPFETGMSTAMAMASTGGANGFANYSKPQGYILQQAMLNSMNGSFRSAAASIGNNDLLMAASIAQAEQSQKSSWFTAARVFSNMMGYVYTTLQAFIFAIVPVVVIALMVPGLGKSIFTNYSQILVWLMLWQPMLSIVNYLITLFGKAQISSTLELAAGVTMQNKWVLTENTNDLMLAAQFLGTSVPLLTWGLVKGSLAFTEFISNGIGSSMAQQAGAQAATGNTSMNNLSMDNASMNKFNTAMSSAVGAQSTMGYVGGAQSAWDQGGFSSARNGTQDSASVSQAMQLAKASQLGESAGLSQSASQTLSALNSKSAENRLTRGSAEASQAIASALDSANQAYQRALSSGDTKAIDSARTALQEHTNSALTYVEANVRGKLGFKEQTDGHLLGSIGKAVTGLSAEAGVEFGAGTGAEANSALARRASAAQSWKEGKSHGDSKSSTTGGSHADSEQTSLSRTNTTSRDGSWSESDQLAVQRALQTAASASSNAGSTASFQKTAAEQASMGLRFTDGHESALEGLRSGPDSIANQGAALDAQVGSRLTNNSDLNGLRQDYRDMAGDSPANAVESQLASRSIDSGMPGMPAHPNGVDVSAKVAAGQAATDAATAAPHKDIAAREKSLEARQNAIAETGAIQYAGERIGDTAAGHIEDLQKLGEQFKPVAQSQTLRPGRE